VIPWKGSRRNCRNAGDNYDIRWAVRKANSWIPPSANSVMVGLQSMLDCSKVFTVANELRGAPLQHELDIELHRH
jgi:hypothetical protein